MNFIRIFMIAVFFMTVLSAPAQADNVVLASGAGYKKMVAALIKVYAQKTGESVDIIFGNMGRVTTLAKQGGKVGLVLGDETFLEKANLPLKSTVELGRGKLVLAFSKLLPDCSAKDIYNPKMKRIALPDGKKAVYGKAARQYLKNCGRLPEIKHKLLEVSTVPQVFSYIATNEVDMGFMNLTHALNVSEKLGGYVLVDETKYSPIRIVVGVLSTCTEPEQQKALLEFLATPAAKEIVRKHGL